MKALLLNHQGYKARVFEGVKFPLIVEGKVMQSGIEKGFLAVTYGEMQKHGLIVEDWIEDFKHDYDHALLFSPDQFEVIA